MKKRILRKAAEFGFGIALLLLILAKSPRMAVGALGLFFLSLYLVRRWAAHRSIESEEKKFSPTRSLL
jgi:hypothetical protein